MDVRFSRASKSRGEDPHNWQTWDNYRTVHQIRLENHPFLDPCKEQPLDFEEDEEESIWLVGLIYCLENVVVEVEKKLETQPLGSLLQVKGSSYRYVAWVDGQNSILRYHNTHRNDDLYHHRVFNWRTGEEVFYETLERSQFPTLSEVLDEVQQIYLAYK